MAIIQTPGEFLPRIFYIDFLEWDAPKLAGGILLTGSEKQNCVLIDTGSSLNVEQVLKSIQDFGCDLQNFSGLIPTHYHFDHNGGAAKLYEYMKKKNYQFRIISNQLTKEYLQNAASHVEGARTSYGVSVGEMPPIPDEAFNVVDIDKRYDIQEILEVNTDLNYEITFVSTPGHTPDHISPLIKYSGDSYGMTLFCVGEAAGTNFNTNKIYSLPTSMPPHYNHAQYMESLEKIILQETDNIAFCHFGAISGNDEVQRYLGKHKEWNQWFYSKVKEIYEETQSTRKVIEYMLPVWNSRTNTLQKVPWLLEKLCIGLVYGSLIDLGLREAKYEKRDE